MSSSPIANVWHTADLHIGHVNILKYMHEQRPFDSLDEMLEALIERFNSVVSKDDTLIIHGDLAMGIITENVPHIKRFNGRKILIPGNHDRCWHYSPQKKRIEKMRIFYRECGLIIVDAPFNLQNIEGVNVTMNHFPWKEFCSDGREIDHHPRMVDYPGWWNIHGHVHAQWKIRPEARMINVGVDVWDLMPVPQETIIQTIKENS